MGSTRQKIIKELSNSYINFYSKDLTKIFNIFINEIKTGLKHGQSVEIRSLARFSIKKQKPRKARNPKTSEKLFIPARNKIVFKMTKELFNKINEK